MTKTATNRVLLSDTEFRDVRDHLGDNAIYFIAGSNSMYVPGTKTKYLAEKVCKTWPDLDGISQVMTPGEAARTELKREFPDLRRVGWRGPMIKLFDARPPMYFTGPRHGDMVQVDLKSAYWQIYRILWLNTPYPRGFGTLPLLNVATRLADWKQARNAVIGLIASREVTGIRGNKRYTLRTQNNFLSPGLWATVQDTLHAIASMAIDYGALYVNTDGYIFYGEADWMSFTDWLNTLKFRWEFKGIGDGHITGWNAYSVGERSTKIYRLKLEVSTYEFSNIKATSRARQIRYINKCRSLSGNECSARQGDSR